MIQQIGWIFLTSLLSTAFSDTPFETGSESLTEALLTTISQFNETENVTSEISLTSSTDVTETTETSTDVNTGSPFVADTTTEINQTLETSSSVLEKSSSKKPVSMSLKADTPEPAYLGEMSTTFQSTSSTLKESLPYEIQGSSTLSDSDKNLYYDSRTTTEHGISHEMSVELPDMIADDNTDKNTPSMGLISENTRIPIVVDEATGKYSKFYDEIKSSTNSETGVDNQESLVTESSHLPGTSMSPTVTVENESRIAETGSADMRDINFSIQNHKTATEVESLELYHKQAEDYAAAESARSPLEILTSETENTSFTFPKSKEQTEIAWEMLDSSEESMKTTEMTTDKEVFFTDHITALLNDYNFENISAEATEINANSTRNPKRIQGEEERNAEGRIRPAHPDPLYAGRPEIDLVRPYRPDSPLYRYPYYKPSSDYRTSLKEDKSYTRPPRPDPEYQRASFRPNYGYSKISQVDTSSAKPLFTSDSSASKPYRPSFSRPYHSQSSFGRPYRPDYHRPASKPADDYSATPKPLGTKGTTSGETEISAFSRDDFGDTRHSESVSGYTKDYHSDVEISSLKTDLGKPYRPTEISMHSQPTSPEEYETRDSVKVPKPDIGTKRPPSIYSRPGSGNNYQTSDSTARPFSTGTVTSAKNLTRVEFIKADCFDNYMKVTMRFNGTFSGLVYSSGYAQDSSCSYVNGSGRNHYEFFIRLNRCGTLGQQEVTEQGLRYTNSGRQERAQYLVNTVTVQYNPVIEEDIDEHFRVTCEYGYDFWKTVTFPIVNVESSAVKVRTGSPVVFTLPPPQCNMEIRSGFGPSGTRVSGPVNVGDPLTLVIHMKSESIGFDILVSNCFAHNGAQKRLQLIDSNGCVVQEKLVSPFRGVSSPDRSQQVTLYTYLKAFRFTGSPALYIECDVHMCHGSCPPQRCYWRHLYKRSAQEMTTEATTTPENIISDSVSLFQALEVRHEEADSQSSLALRYTHGMDKDDMVCLRTGGFAAIFACLLLLLVTTTFAAVCMCLRMRKLKRFVEAPDTKHFVEFSGHVPLK